MEFKTITLSFSLPNQVVVSIHVQFFKCMLRELVNTCVMSCVQLRKTENESFGTDIFKGG